VFAWVSIDLTSSCTEETAVSVASTGVAVTGADTVVAATTGAVVAATAAFFAPFFSTGAETGATGAGAGAGAATTGAEAGAAADFFVTGFPDLVAEDAFIILDAVEEFMAGIRTLLAIPVQFLVISFKPIGVFFRTFLFFIEVPSKECEFLNEIQYFPFVVIYLLSAIGAEEEMPTRLKFQCTNIRSPKYPDESCKYTTTKGDFCSRHQKNQKVFITTSYPIVTQSIQKSVRKLQRWWRLRFAYKMVKEKSPAFFNRDLCHNNTDLASLEPVADIPRDYFFVIRDSNRLWGFDLRTLVSQYEATGRLENPYTKMECSSDVVEQFRKSVDILRKLKKPVQYDVSTGLSSIQNWNLRVLDLCLHLDMLGYRISTNWFSDLDISGHRRLYIELYILWTDPSGLTNAEKECLVPNYSAEDFLLFKWSPIKVMSKNDLDGIRRTNLNILERLTNSATLQSDKTLGAMYCVMGLTRVSNRCRQAYPWLAEQYGNA